MKILAIFHAYISLPTILFVHKSLHFVSATVLNAPNMSANLSCLSIQSEDMEIDVACINFQSISPTCQDSCLIWCYQTCQVWADIAQHTVVVCTWVIMVVSGCDCIIIFAYYFCLFLIIYNALCVDPYYILFRLHDMNVLTC